jgi:hypothetical protein
MERNPRHHDLTQQFPSVVMDSGLALRAPRNDDDGK